MAKRSQDNVSSQPTHPRAVTAGTAPRTDQRPPQPDGAHTSRASTAEATDASDAACNTDAPPPHPPAADLSRVLRRAAAGGTEAWRELSRRYGPRVFAMARSHLGDHNAAEDVLQSVFVTLAEKLPAGDYEERGRFEPWLFRITMNRVRDEARRRARRARPVAPDTLADAADRNGYAGPATYISHPRCSHATMAHNAAHSPDAIGVTDDHDRRALRAALDGLDDDDRLIVDMRHVGGMSFKQIADCFGCPLGTALARHHRALAKLRSAMQATLGRAETAGDAADASTSTGASR